MSADLSFDAVDTPVGVVGVVAGPAGVRRTGWRLRSAAGLEPDEMVQRALGQLGEYFAGEREQFDLPLDLPTWESGTRAVLLTLASTVGYGQTITYAELARRSGTCVPARAIGAIMAANPVPILIPCHRVVASDGLGGYSGGDPGREIETKRWLLENEGALPPRLL